jgi:DNA-binding NtrC family response regulator
MNVVHVVRAGDDVDLTRAVLPDQDWRDCEQQLRSGPQPAAYVLTLADIEHICSIGCDIADRGTKRPQRALARMLLHRTGMPLVRGTYRVAGQLVRSVRDLLTNAAIAGENKPFLIGVDADLFARLWHEARLPAEDHAPEIAAVGWGALPGLGDESFARRLLAQMSPVEEPTDVQQMLNRVSCAAKVMRQMVVRAAALDEPVLVHGQPGTGKEIVVRLITHLSARKDRPAQHVNCAIGTIEMLRAELFGTAETIRPGATIHHKGKWEQATDGTIVLDEISELPRSLQQQVSNTLQLGAFRPAGASEDVAARARLIAVTSRDLGALVDTDRFSAELYHRINLCIVRTPTLGDHPDDVEALAKHFWAENTGGAGTLSTGVLGALRSYGWPGNVRELRDFLAGLYLLFRTDVPTVEQVRLLFEMRSLPSVPEPAPNTREADNLRWRQRQSQLRRVSELVGSCRYAIQQALGDSSSAAQSRAVASIDRSLSELGELSASLPYLGDESLFTVVHNLHGQLILASSRAKASGGQMAWDASLLASLTEAQGTVTRSLDRVSAMWT